MKLVFWMAGMFLLPVMAAAQTNNAFVLSDDDAQKVAVLSKQRKHDAGKQISGMSHDQLTQALKDNLSDKTKIIYQKGYGVYVEYSAADGSDRMWFPGNSDAVYGIWQVKESWGTPAACFHYFNSRDAVTGEVNATDCISPKQTLGNSDVIDERPGDVFNLMPGGIPYRKSSMDIPTWPDGTQAKP